MLNRYWPVHEVDASVYLYTYKHKMENTKDSTHLCDTYDTSTSLWVQCPQYTGSSVHYELISKSQRALLHTAVP